MPSPVEFLGTNLRIATKEETLVAIDNATRRAPIRIATVNPEFMLEARRNPGFRKALEAMDFSTVDGTGVFFMLKALSRISSEQIPLELYHGSDLTADLFQVYSEGQKSFYLLGGKPGLALKAKEAIQIKYPQIRIAGAEDGGVIDQDKVAVDPQLLNRINQAAPDILLVGFGMPKQELWIQNAAATLRAAVAIGIGGTLDFYTVKKRAPRMFRALHLEWLYRSLFEKGHAKRAWRAVVVFSLYSLAWLGKRLATRGNEAT